MIYVTLPDEYVAVPKFPGYFVHIPTKTVYSIKIGGELKPLSYQYSFYTGFRMIKAGYNLSRNGKKHRLPQEAVDKIAANPTPSVVPIKQD